MEIVKTVNPKKTKSEKYMFVCKTCKMDDTGGFNYSKTVFIAEYPKDFFTCISPRKYCKCPVCGTLHERSILARLRYVWYEHKNK